MKFKNYFIIIFVGAILYLPSLCSAQLVSIVLTDTFAGNIGYSVESDLRHVYLETNRIAEVTGLKHNEIILSNTELNVKNIYDSINDLKLKSDDIVFLYYSGHGYRTEDSTTQWPNIYITNDNAGMSFEHIVRLIQDKNPRFILAIADCCNNALEGGAPEVKSIKALLYVDKHIIAGFKKLFLNQKGVIIVSGSSIGEYSIGTDQGGVLTNAFLENLESEVRLKGVFSDWSALLQRTADHVSQSADKEVPQHPQYLITSRI